MLQKSMTTHWVWWLVGYAALFWIVNSALFYPGYLSPDSIHQLSQALGTMPVTDWHPPAMQLVWHVLIFFTHHTSAMLLFQTLLLWASLLLVALALYKATRSRCVSLMPLAIGSLPFVLNISGVIWKDVQMADALLLATAILIYLPTVKVSRNLRWIMVGTAIALITYATLLRYNLLLAVLPIMYLIAVQSTWASSWQRKAVVMISLLGLVGVSNLVVSFVTHPQSTHPASAIMLDDVINIISRDKLKSISLSSELKDTLLMSQAKCSAGGRVMNAYWVCLTEPQQQVISITKANELTMLWLRTVATHPIAYIGYRAETFAQFLVVPQSTEYVWQNGIEPNQLSQAVGSQRAQHVMKAYVVDWGYRNFWFLYQPWFWLLMSAVLLRVSRRLKTYKKYVFALALSALIYILSYVPSVVAMDYRYIYWPILAILIAGILVVVEKQKRLRSIIYNIFA